jgi:hypothetical protein
MGLDDVHSLACVLPVGLSRMWAGLRWRRAVAQLGAMPFWLLLRVACPRWVCVWGWCPALSEAEFSLATLFSMKSALNEG